MYGWDVENPEHRMTLKVARAWGVSPSIFMGRQPITTTLTNENGTWSKSESDWTQEDRETAILLAIYESTACPGCGDQLSETTDSENQFQYETDQYPTRCHKCTAIGIKSDQITKNARDSDQTQALFFSTTLRRRAKSDDGSEVDSRS